MCLLVLLVTTSCSSGDDRSSDTDPSQRTGPTTNDSRIAHSEPTRQDEPGRVEDPMVTRASGGQGQASGGLRFDVMPFDYEEAEYFFAGHAKTYPPSEDEPVEPYRSRMIMWTPTDPARSNGVTIVEWAQVSDFGQFELTVELSYQASMLMNRGYAFALVSAEEAGVCDRSPTGCSPYSLQGADPARYGPLDHPGDAYSFDIFSQALQAIKYPSGASPLRGLARSIVIAEGFQSSIDKWFPVGAPDSDNHLAVQHLRVAQRLPRQRGGRGRPARRCLPCRWGRTRSRADSVPGADPAPSGRVGDPSRADARPAQPRDVGGRWGTALRPVGGKQHHPAIDRRPHAAGPSRRTRPSRRVQHLRPIT